LFNYRLHIEAIVYDIQYETNLEELIKHYTKRKVTLLAKATINNHNPDQFEATISKSRALTDEFSFDFHDAWANFYRVHVNYNTNIETSTGFSKYFSAEISKSINLGHKYENQQISGWKTNPITSKARTFDISKKVKVIPNSSIKIFSYINFIERMPVKVKFKFKITSKAFRENLNLELKQSYLDGAFVNILMEKRGLNSRINIVGQEKYAVLGELDATIFASFGFNIVFDVENSSEVIEENDMKSSPTTSILLSMISISISVVILLILTIVLYFIFKYTKKNRRVGKIIQNDNIRMNQEIIGTHFSYTLRYNNNEIYEQYAKIEENRDMYSK